MVVTVRTLYTYRFPRSVAGLPRAADVCHESICARTFVSRYANLTLTR